MCTCESISHCSTRPASPLLFIHTHRPAFRLFVCVSLTLLADHLGVLIVGVVGVPQPPVPLDLELHELVPELARVPDAVVVAGWLCGIDERGGGYGGG